ncbi:MAG TPA: hypothetical protein VLT47_00495 [Anaeromyxobacteraceae bacterium]|nr:hypothetical protein [Anaeromyxobacteraceae bacterium]
MDRRVSIRAAAALTLLAAGACQDYNFNPVGHCLIQPGSQRVTLSDVSSADVLFVVDDSGSMEGEQTNLASQFPAFLNVLKTANAERVKTGVAPIDFHIGITTTSVFRNAPPGLAGASTCSNSCQGTGGALTCCLASTGTPQPPQCRADSDCATGFKCKPYDDGVAGTTPATECAAAKIVGGKGCFASADCTPQRIPCSVVDAQCGNLQKFYSTLDTTVAPPVETWPSTAQCKPGYADNLFSSADEYPIGRFVTAAAGNTVLSFDKGLFCTWDAAQGKCTDADLTNPAINTTELDRLSAAFSTNIAVGTCGSGQEQGLVAAKLAVDRVNAGTQSAGYVPGSFLHDKSKLAIVWVTDEDDCSSPMSAADGVVFTYTPPAPPAPESDGCKDDAALPAGSQRETAIASFADYFTSLGRPVAAGFITSAPSGCQDQSCTASICCDTACTGNASICSNAVCGGQGVPNRYVGFAGALRTRGVDVVAASICDAFGPSLGRIAEIVKTPPGLKLPTTPAAGQVTVLRITRSDGSTRKSCVGPAPAGMTTAAAAAAGYDWWFTPTADPADPAAVSVNVYINHSSGRCEAGPGETYSADYIGQLPPGGCSDAEGGPAPSCKKALGGEETDWECVGFTGTVGTLNGTGTCTCVTRK